MSLPSLSEDPEFQSAAKELGRLLGGPTVEEVLASLQTASERALALDGDSRIFAGALIEVIRVLVEWNSDKKVDRTEQVGQMLEAIERGMRI